VHAADQPLVSDFTLTEWVERHPRIWARWQSPPIGRDLLSIYGEIFERNVGKNTRFG
jgi:hypothetical protein